jgi:hypothetical protein
MQGNSFIEPQDIFNATNGGLEIIFQLYPDAVGSETRHNRKFKIREEKSASASLKKADDGNWLVTDFGGDSKPRNGIQCYMDERGISWVDAIKELAVKYNVLSPERQAQIIRADFAKRPANADEDDGKWSYEVRTHFTELDIETIISKNVLKHVKWKAKLSETTVTADGKLDEKTEAKILDPYNRIAAVFKKYRWHSLISYSIVKNREVMTFSANDQYPIFLIDEGTHKKIYQPRHPEKNMRFMYEPGHKPADFIHGLAQLEDEYKANKKRIESEEQDEHLSETGSQGEDLQPGVDTAKKSKKKESPKIDELVLATGGSDAINIALMGDRVIWLNSETATLHQWQYDKIMIMVDKLYQLPDIDMTGRREAHKLAMQYLDIFTIELPEALKERRDPRGNACKDVRDYFNFFGYKDYKAIKAAALPYRFWEKSPKYVGRGNDRYFDGWDYGFDNVQAYNFLIKNGFGRLRMGDKKTDWMYIRRIGNIVYAQHPNDVKEFVHTFLKERLHDKNLRNAMFRTTQLNESSLSNLDAVDIDFTDNTAESQFVFFQNKTAEVTKDGIKFHKAGVIDRYIWEEDVLKHHIEEVKQPPFKITRDELGTYDIEILDKNCPFLKYLVQTSRIHWRKELEENLESLFAPADREQYLKDNHCTIAGANLTAEEIEEQKQNLINKLFVIGFLLHRYKARNKAWFTWAMDSKIPDDGGSHGGSGKSILFDMALRRMMPKNYFMNGRNPKLTDDPHKYDGLTEHDRYIYVDDAHEYVNLDVFYPDITGDMKVNPKGKQPFTIPFENSPKMAFTSNYSPRKLGPSTERRMIYCIFSDYYHNKGETDDYREIRDPKMDLGLTLFTEFSKDQHNSFYNLMLHCLQFYLGVEEKLKPAMENVNKRNLLAAMGNLHEWALVFFSAEGGRLDEFIVREEAAKDYDRYNGKKITPQSFLTRLKAFCKYYGYVLNPIEFRNKQGNIIRKVEARMYNESSNSWVPMPGAPKPAKEMLYIQTRNELPHDEDAAPAKPAAPEPPKQMHLDIENYNPPEFPDEPEERDDEPF